MSKAKRLALNATLLSASSLLISGIVTGPVAVAADSVSGVQHPQIDLAFCIDTTGSMQSEIDAVKSKTKEIVAKLSGSKPSPDIRVGLVAFRDRGDEYVTKIFPFSSDIDKVVKDISSLKADGGGDMPEAVNEGLHASVEGLQWRENKKAVKLLFLIGDAGPKHYPGDYSWDKEARNAISRGIQINTIACDGLHSQGDGLDVFQKVAKLSDGKCEFLTYRQEIADAKGRKSTVLSAGGKLYEVKSADAAKWREGASALMARGAAAPSPSAMSDGFASAEGSGVAMPMARMGKALESRSRGVFAGGPAAPSASSYAMRTSAPSVSRAENNLADLVLSATKEAAKKKANIVFDK